MTQLPNGKYETKAGSTMEISGSIGGRSKVDFDWLEEGGCCDCKPEPYHADGFLVWYCDCCGGGRAKLYPA